MLNKPQKSVVRPPPRKSLVRFRSDILRPEKSLIMKFPSWKMRPLIKALELTPTIAVYSHQQL